MPASFVTYGRPVPALSSATIPSSSAIFALVLRLLVGVEAGGEGMPVDLAEFLESVEPFEYLLYPDVHRRPLHPGPAGDNNCDSQV